VFNKNSTHQQMQILQQILFVAALGVATYLITRRVNLIKKTIQLGRSEERQGDLGNMILFALGQKKMFNRPVVGILHFIIYAGFLLINLEVLEIVLDGILGSHRLFAPLLGSFYPFLINFFEFLAVGVIVVCVVFLIRRNITKVDRLQESRHRELGGFPILDANTILITEILLMLAILSMNAADSVLQGMNAAHYGKAGTFFFSGFMKPIFEGWSESALVIYERAAWWFHILGIFAFALYVTYSKHLHIFMAFPNTYFTSKVANGKMTNMPAVTKEVKIMLGMEQADSTPAEPERFGAKDVQDLSWKNLMDAYTCTECGRCTSACPANQTGKALSPRKIMMDTRDRLEDIQKGWLKNGAEYSDEKSLMGDYISEEEILACTTCNACVEECPVNISPLDIILQLRRYKVMEESQAPASWNMMFQNLETSMSPWKFPLDERVKWMEQVKE
jgi:heterodisulfide reductase subunit C